MSQTFHLPDLGEGVHEGQVLKILVAAGEPIVLDQPLMEVETDKAAVEIPSPFAGTVDTWHVQEQQVVNVGDAMVTVRVEGSAESAQAPAGASSSASAGSSATATAAPQETTVTTAGDEQGGTRNGHGSAASARRRPASPAVRTLARRLGVDLHGIEGSGPGGRILRADVQAAADGGGTASAAAANASTVPSPTASPAPAPAPASSHAAAAPAPAPAPAPLAGVRTPVPDAARVPDHATAGSDDRGEFLAATLSRTRLSIARTMTAAVQSIPHVTDCDDVDVTELLAFRKSYNASVAPEQKVGVLSFVIRAVARALQAFPIFNASWDEANERVLYRRGVHVAVGVQTPRGLVAPVIRDADRLAVSRIEQALAALTDKCRAGRFEPADAAGATYTISNAGAMGGSRYATPIITPPQVAVLAVGRTRAMPWVVDGDVVPRSIMPLSHSMDHRLIDGAVEIAFMQHVIADLEHPGRMLV